MIIAHRGYYTKYIPENSMMAFKRCIDKNIPFELDVHLTKDNKVVVFHEYNLLRMTGLNQKIEDTTYEELNKLYLDKSKEKIPLLSEVLKINNDKVFMLIELKNKIIGPLEDEVIKITKSYHNFYFQTFKLKSIYYLKKLTDKKIGLLVMDRVKRRYLNSNKIDFISHNLFTFEKLKTDKEIFIFNIDNNLELDLARKYANNFIVDIANIEK